MDSLTNEQDEVKGGVPYLAIEAQNGEWIAFAVPGCRYLGRGNSEGECLMAVQREHAGARRVAVVRAVETGGRY